MIKKREGFRIIIPEEFLDRMQKDLCPVCGKPRTLWTRQHPHSLPQSAELSGYASNRRLTCLSKSSIRESAFVGFVRCIVAELASD